MLKPAQMSELTCIVTKSRKEQVIRKLHEAGIVQVVAKEGEETGLERLTQSQDHEYVKSTLGELRHLLDELSPYLDEKASFLDEILGVEQHTKTKYPTQTPEQLRDRYGAFSKQVMEDINSGLKRLYETTLELDRVIIKKSNFSTYKILELDTKWLSDSDYTTSVLGQISKDDYLRTVGELDEALGKDYFINVLLRGQKIVAYMSAPFSSKDAFDDILRKNGFERLETESEGRICDIYDGLEDDEERLKKTEAQLADSLRSKAKKYVGEIRELHELFSLELERQNTLSELFATEKTMVLTFFVPTKDKVRAVALVEDACDRLCHISSNDELEDAPTLLDNPGFLKPFEMFTNLFSQPRYGQIDPTAFTAPSFVIFFGFMLGDAVYGLIVTAISIWLRRKYKGVAKVENFSMVLFWCGLSAIVFGVLTGSYLGDTISKYVWGVENSGDLLFAVIDPLYKTNSITLLIIAVSVGLIQTLFGNVLGFLDKLSSNRKKQAVTENLSWLIMAFGAVLFISGLSLEGGLAFLTGFVLLLWGMGFMALMEIPGVLGRVVSYSRLLALHLTTPGMGLAFNFLASMLFSIPVIGWLLAAMVYITSHIIILLMNSLGSFVHALRLHYVEYYSTFYSGGGTAFQPFYERRKYTIKEE